jgi:hypothetical protein
VQIYIARDGEQTGPVSMEQLVTMAGQGTVSPSDLAWHEGLAGWVAVSEVLPTKTGAVVLSPSVPRTSKMELGFAGFVIGVAGVPLWVIVLVIAGRLGSGSHYMAMLGVGLIAMGVVNAVGLTLGVVALLRQRRAKGAADYRCVFKLDRNFRVCLAPDYWPRDEIVGQALQLARLSDGVLGSREISRDCPA